MAEFEGDLFQKLFEGYIFCFLVHSDGRYIFELSARETNLMKKRIVRQNLDLPKHIMHVKILPILDVSDAREA